MLQVYRLLMTLMIGFFVAQPVMACCLAGHQSAQAAVERAEPPCHDAADKGTTDFAVNKYDAPDPADCPGCVDCDILILASQAPDNLGRVTANVADDAVTMAPDMGFAGFEPELPTLATGPPRDTSLPLRTPISLKQRLLI